MKSKNVLFVILITGICLTSCFSSILHEYDKNQYELPEMKDTSYGMFIQREYYSMVYSHKLFHAKWVAFQLIDGKIPKIKLQTLNKDFKSEMYQRGHLVPNRYLKEKNNVNDNEHDIYNIVPQTEKLNNGVWRTLENKCDTWSKEEKISEYKIKNMYITAGCISNENSEKLNDKITIPDSLFKVILFELKKGGFKSIGFVFPNDTNFNCLCSYAKTVNEVEKSTSLTFFNALDTNQFPELKSDTSLVRLLGCDDKNCPYKKEKTKR